MDNIWRLSALILGLFLAPLHAGCITVNLPPGPAALQEYNVSGDGKDKVLLVDLSGVISSESREGFYSYPSLLATIKEELSKAAKDERVKAMVLRINSPGGTVTASDIIYHELKSFKAAHNIPIVASIMDVGASGGYYIASAADAVMAHPSSVTGSIGVIMLTVNARGLLEKVGVEANAVTSGPRKDMGVLPGAHVELEGPHRHVIRERHPHARVFPPHAVEDHHVGPHVTRLRLLVW